MTPKNALIVVHPTGGRKIASDFNQKQAIEVETYGGKIHVEWDPQVAVTPLGQLPFFIDFLKTADLFAPWVRDCPLSWKSPNAPGKTEILGTLLLSILAGHHRYSHIATIRSDGVNPALLGMKKVASEDSVRKSFIGMDQEQGQQWMTNHLRHCYEPLLYEPWILDIDTTVKPLYGHQEGAEVGYNPQKPGRPSHTYHTYFMANLRLAYEYAVLVTTLSDGIETIVQHYRDRADSENNFDELKNQWGWGGYTTHDLARCRMMARVIALTYNWWSLFVRLAIPNKHAEAITSRPLLLQAVGKQTWHGGRRTLTLTSMHAEAKNVKQLLISLGSFLREIRENAEQLGWESVWRKILSRVFRWFLRGRSLTPPPLLPTPV